MGSTKMTLDFTDLIFFSSEKNMAIPAFLCLRLRYDLFTAFFLYFDLFLRNYFSYTERLSMGFL